MPKKWDGGKGCAYWGHIVQSFLLTRKVQEVFWRMQQPSWDLKDGSAFSRDRSATLRQRLCYCPQFLEEVAAALTGQMTPINDVEGTCLHGIWTQSQHQNISSVPDSARWAASGHGEDMGVAGRKKCDITHYIYAWLGHMHRDRERHMGPPGSRHLGNRELQETYLYCEATWGNSGFQQHS